MYEVMAFLAQHYKITISLMTKANVSLVMYVQMKRGPA